MQFSKPVKLTIPAPGVADGTIAKIMVQHGLSTVRTDQGLTTNPDAFCENGVSSFEDNAVTIVGEAAVIHTCAASTFTIVFSGSAGDVTITSPISGSTVSTETPTISGTGNTSGMVIVLTGSIGNLGTGTVNGSGDWSIVPVSGLGTGTHTVCVSTGASCTTFTVVTSASPGGVLSNIALWMKADDQAYNDDGVTLASSGDDVKEWYDQTTNDRHADETTASRQPVYREDSINYNPALDFE